jgi:prepilin-type N-terminal cleavage/methylation domain-containing protein
MPEGKLKAQSSKLKALRRGRRGSVWNLGFGVWPLRAGFTLIEFVVVLGILGFVVASTVLFLNSVLKGANQANITQEVKQNGQAILDSLDRQVRGAIAASGVDAGPDYTTIELVRLNDDPLYLKCFSPIGNTQNGRIGSAVSASGAPASYFSIGNDDLINGVNVTNCKFNIVSATVSSQGVQNPAVVTVSFVVSQGLGAPDRQDFAATAPFMTTISLRTY